MRPKKQILLYCADRELLSTIAFTLRLHPYEVTAVDDSRNAAAIMMASDLVCGILIHARQGDFAGRLIAPIAMPPSASSETAVRIFV